MVSFSFSEVVPQTHGMMSNKLDNLETVCEGWLTKSPPTTRIWRARWRRRWFILRNSGELPGQYFLCYYTDRNCRKLKGQIDLDQCEQVDAGLRFESNKLKYQHMFIIRTPKRTYYLAADSDEDMNKWVDCVCHVCGLKPFISEDTVTEYEGDNISQATTGITEISPPVTPSTIITGPYIPLKECISGKPINNAEDLKQFLLQHGHHKSASAVVPSEHRADSYDQPRNLRLPDIVIEMGSTPPPSPDSESVFTDDESVQKLSVSSKKPSVNWETFPRPSDSSIDGEEGVNINTITSKADHKFTKLTPTAPPRPPKPSYLGSGEAQSDGKSDESKTKPDVTQDDMYDIPRSHQIISDGDTLKKVQNNRHCYTNAAPGHVTGEGNYFRYDTAMTNPDELPESPRSETGSVSFSNALPYSNLASPSFSTGGGVATPMPSTPPFVNRDLKPGRKCSDSTGGSNEPSPILTPYRGPIIDRNKKPVKPAQLKKVQETTRADNSIVLCSPPVGSLGRRKQRAGPSQTPPNNALSKTHNAGFATTGRMHRRHSSSDDGLAPGKEEIQTYQFNNMTFRTPRSREKNPKKFREIQYLDLDLDSTDNSSSGAALVRKSFENVHTPSTATVYKTVDFLKTEAFNRTRIEIEEERNRHCAAGLAS